MGKNGKVDSTPKATLVGPSRRRPHLRHPSLAGLLLLTIFAVTGSTPAAAAVPAGNLLANGDAELGTGATDASTVSPVPIPDWTTSPNFTELVYDPGGAYGFPDTADSAAIGGGTQFFAGGPDTSVDESNNNTTETASQSVDLSAAAAEIDAGRVSATLAAALGGFEDQGDNATVTASFLNAASTSLGQAKVGPVTPANRGDETKLISRSGTANLPAGTRTVQVVITANRLDGSYNDGYIDNVSLTLGPKVAPPVVGPKGNPLGLPTPHGCVERKKFAFRIRHAPHARIVAATAFVNGKRKLSKHGSNITRLVLKRLPKGRFVVRVEATHNTGTEFISKETYKGCKKGKRHRHHHHHHG